MNTLALSFPAIRRRPLRVLAWAGLVLSGMAEGLKMARHYNSLASLSDPELARLGVARADIPRIVADVATT